MESVVKVERADRLARARRRRKERSQTFLLLQTHSREKRAQLILVKSTDGKTLDI